MIKFVCSSCGERLSVPDLHGGRKGVCPSCHAVNRIPLKGFAETQPRTPVVARPDGGLATKPRESAATSTTIGKSAKPPKSNRAPEARRPEPAQREFVSEPLRSAAPAAESFEPDSTFDDSPSSYAPITKERRLPKKLRIALLILAALAVVAALYFALYFALQTLIGKSE